MLQFLRLVLFSFFLVSIGIKSSYSQSSGKEINSKTKKIIENLKLQIMSFLEPEIQDVNLGLDKSTLEKIEKMNREELESLAFQNLLGSGSEFFRLEYRKADQNQNIPLNTLHHFQVLAPFYQAKNFVSNPLEINQENIETHFEVKLDWIPYEKWKGLFRKEFKNLFYELKKSIPVKGILSLRDLQKKIVVKTRQTVDVYYEKANLKITTSGEALNSGAIGDEIRVLSFNNKKVLTGKVVDEHSIQISF